MSDLSLTKKFSISAPTILVR